jgi:PAS domain-containing protein
MSDELAVDALRMHPDLVLVAELEPDAHEMIVRYANAAAVSILGRPTSEIIGRPLRTLLVDAPALASLELRKAFFARMREQGTIEFPSGLALLDGSGGRRNLRVRVRFEPGQSRLIVIGEDASARLARDENALATERLRASKELSQLLSHHVNNALAATLLSVEMAREEVRGAATDPGSSDVSGLLDSAVEGIAAAAQVLTALATTQALDAEVAESTDLARVLDIVIDSLAPTVQLSESTPAGVPRSPAWVWGGAGQLDVILSGVLAHAARHAPGDCRVRLSHEDERVIVEIRVTARAGSSAGSDSADEQAWLRPLLDPAGAYPGLGSSPVRLFASTLVLHAIGARVELPGLHGNDAAIALHFRAAPGPLTLPEPPPRVLLVSRDGALHAAVTTLLAPRPVQYCDSLRDGLWRIMRTGCGVVICDVDSLGVTASQALAFARAVADLGANRLIMTSREPASLAATAGVQLAIPFSREQLLHAIDDDGMRLR